MARASPPRSVAGVVRKASPVSSAPSLAAPARRGLPSRALRRVLAAFLALHGLAHLAGTGDVVGEASDGGSVEYLAGAWTVSDPTVLRMFGVVWALLAAAFLVAAAVTWTGRSGWPRVLALVASASLALVLVALWSSVIGVAVDLALLVVAWWSASAGGRDGAGEGRVVRRG